MEYRNFYGYQIYTDGTIISQNNRILKHTIKNGRKEIRLTVNGVRKSFISARLIYCVFNDIDIFTLDKNECISFKDNNKLNISLDNLVRVFRGDLIQGVKHKNISKLTQEQIEEIKEKYENTIKNRPINQHDRNEIYNSYRTLATEYGVTFSLIKQIIEGKIHNEKNYKLIKN